MITSRPADREGYMAALQARIDANYGADAARQILDEMRSRPPRECVLLFPVLPFLVSVSLITNTSYSNIPENLKHLPKLVAKRVQELESLKQCKASHRHAETQVNIDALIHAYTNEELTVAEGEENKVCYFFNGKRKTGWQEEYDGKTTIAMIRRWHDEEGGVGHVWPEMVKPIFQYI